MNLTDWKSYLEQNKQAALDDLVEFLRIPSISTDPVHQADVRKAAQWTAQRIRQAGISDVRIFETTGHPVVYAERIESEDLPTVLFYGHFDVQPVDPIELWTHPPFEPHIEDGRIYARAASDMKGDVLLPIIACEAFLKTEGHIPINVKFLIEGEEEIGSPSLGPFIAEHKELLSCHFAISMDGGIGSVNKPIIGLSARGLIGVQIGVQTANVDLHSGLGGGYAPNALHALVSILDALRDDQGRILVDGFYDDVLPITEEDKPIAEAVAPDFEAWAEQVQFKVFGEPEYSPMERAFLRPTLEINGMWGGFQGEGGKTVIPREAFAKITCRLVANQNPHKIAELLKAYILRVAPDYAEVSVEDLPGFSFPYRLPSDHNSVAALQKVIEQSTGNAAQFVLTGGTVPVMGMLQEILGVETITVGACEDDERWHAPDEFLRLENYYRLQEIFCMYMTQLATAL